MKMKSLSINPKKTLGQNFLINEGILEKIVIAAEIKKEDTIIEIGPGTGNLTKKLAEKAKKVVSIEKDHRLIKHLSEQFKNSNVEIVEADILRLDIQKLLENSASKTEDSHFKIVANIPYYITSNLIRTIFESVSWQMVQLKLIVLTIQKEVAKRIVAKPPHMNLLAISVQFYSEPKIMSYVSRGSFRPIPNVDSAIIKLVPKTNPALLSINQEFFFKVVRAGFSGKRKQLIKNLAANFGMLRDDLLKVFEKLDIKPDARAETLLFDQWIKLARHIKSL